MNNDLISRQAALDAMETWDKFGCDPDGKLVRYDDDSHYVPYVHYEDMVHVIKHLPSAQQEQTDCDYCHEDSDGYVKPIEKNCHAFIRFGMNGWELSLKANGWHGSAKIQYCPMCGRRLTDG